MSSVGEESGCMLTNIAVGIYIIMPFPGDIVATQAKYLTNCLGIPCEEGVHSPVDSFPLSVTMCTENILPDKPSRTRRRTEHTGCPGRTDLRSDPALSSWVFFSHSLSPVLLLKQKHQNLGDLNKRLSLLQFWRLDSLRSRHWQRRVGGERREGVGREFLNLTSKVYPHVKKWINGTTLNLKLFCSAKDPVKMTKRQITDWNKIFADHKSNQELVTRICKELSKLHIK